MGVRIEFGGPQGGIDFKFPNYIDYHVLSFCKTMLFIFNDVYIVKKVKK